MQGLSAFVLAGGRSSRMGTEKAWLTLEGETLLERALRLCRGITPTVSIAGPREKFAACGTVVEDVYRDCGPLGAIHAALCATATDLNFILAVDMPFVLPQLIERLVEEARASNALVTVPCIYGRFEPLCAVYRRQFRDAADASLARGRCKIDSLFSSVVTRVLDQADFERFAFDPAMFQNLNTRQDLLSAQSGGPKAD
ncbi:MAG: molybdenum cofactor guanylyltransferase [Terriglobales bacterium]